MNILAGNWKMNLGPEQGAVLARALTEVAPSLNKTELWIAPPFLTVASVAEVTTGTPLRVGVQNIHWEESGAFTGEISTSMARESGCSFAIVGHSERRHVFGEDDNMIRSRALAALSGELTTIFCIGETLESREAGETFRILEEQLKGILPEVSDSARHLVFAYEPVWAIGTGKVASIKEIEEAHGAITELWKSHHPTLDCPPILYGGSVNPDNFEGIIALPNVSGGLVGGASLSEEKFRKLAEISEAS